MDKLDQNKILVIGGSGFVGTNLITLVGNEKCINFDKNQSIKYKNITQICDIKFQFNNYSSRNKNGYFVSGRT